MDVTTWIIHLSIGPGGISAFCVKSQFYISHYFRNWTLAHYQLFSSVVYIAIWTGKCSRSRVYAKRQALLGVLLWTMLQIQLLHKVSKRFSYPSQAKRNFYKRFERTSLSRYLEYGDLRSAWCVCETEKSAWKGEKERALRKIEARKYCVSCRSRQVFQSEMFTLQFIARFGVEPPLPPAYEDSDSRFWRSYRYRQRR